MTETVRDHGAETLRLDSTWRVADRPDAGATVHSLRVIEGTPRPERRDDEALRALIVEVVREELRSDLGRRMTSAIRTLVRQEVERLFARLGRR